MSDIMIPEDGGGLIIDEPMGEALSRRYLAYALSTIMHRALPDVRDGLKPVHRRILYSMMELKLEPQSAAKKCAKVVGEVMGNFHPHGDQSIYDAMVRLAQNFSQRYPLIDGQGNFGNIDGDSAAAMRYTECRLTRAAILLMEGISDDTVDFRTTYDGENSEPIVLPAGFPNLLANGSTGIAVGMATSIPPHNVFELIDGCRLILKEPQVSIEELVKLIPGPDFPTGGVIVEPLVSILQSYHNGRGSIRLRANYRVEDMGRGTWRIVVYEIPYQVQKSRLIEQLADLIEAKKAPLLGDVRDESDEQIRLVLEPKVRTIDPQVLMESLFKISDLETRFPVNMNVLEASGTPRVLGLKACLVAFLDHRREVLIRRCQTRKAKIERRLHLLDGLMIAFLNLDEVIRIIRFEEQPRALLIERFSISENQADYILDTRLRALARLEEMMIKKEFDELSKELAELEAILTSEAKQWKMIDKQLIEVQKILNDPRRSLFAEAPQGLSQQAMDQHLPKEQITVIVSHNGWIRAAKGRIEDGSELKFKDGDSLAFLRPATTADKLLVLSSDGRILTLPCEKLPSARGQGEPLRLLLDLEESARIVDVFIAQTGRKRVMVSKSGYGFVCLEDELIGNKKAGKQIMSVDGTEAFAALELVGDRLIIWGDNNKILVFDCAELPIMTKGKGVKLQAYKDGGLKDIGMTRSDGSAYWYDGSGKAREFKDIDLFKAKRASAGKMAPRGLRGLRPPQI